MTVLASIPSSIDWRALFEPSLGIGELVLRGSLIYLSLFLILRFIARRQTGSFGPADLLVVVLIADAAQNGFAKDYTSVTEAVVLVATIIAWDYLIDWLAWRIPALRPFVKAPALKLIADGKIVPSGLRQEMISEDDLASQLREHGVEDVGSVRLAVLEGDGRLSVITYDKPSS